MTTVAASILCMAIAYVCGCINSAYYSVLLLSGKDLRQFGSGTLGARNTRRICGTPLAVFVLLFDMLKVWPALALLAALHATTDFGQALVTFFGIVGHVYPAQLGFRGGKGAAVLGGAVLYTWIFHPEYWFIYVNILFVVHAHVKKKPIHY